jgi:hypothetical protein
LELGKEFQKSDTSSVNWMNWKKCSKTERDVKFIYDFSLRRLLRDSDFIWKSEGNSDQEI